MNILKSSYLNSRTLNVFEKFNGKYFFYGFFYVCLKFHGNVIIKCNSPIPFVGIAKMWEGFPNQNNTLLDYYIIHMWIDFTTYARLGYEPSSFTKF